MAESENLRYVLRVRLYKDEKCFGPGIAELLRLISDKHSLRAAAAEMDMAYSKAWRIVKNAENTLCIKLINSATGGKNGGGAELTPEAVDLLSRYDEFVRELHEAGDKLFLKYFPPQSNPHCER